jgi:hypothetical protein
LFSILTKSRLRVNLRALFHELLWRGLFVDVFGDFHLADAVSFILSALAIRFAIISAFAFLAWFAVKIKFASIREIRVKGLCRRPPFYFLHFARKTFNPWAWIQN